MDAVAIDGRQQRGLVLLKEKTKRFKHVAGPTYYVPSQTNTSAGYVVNVKVGLCSCPDHEDRGVVCKHLWAVRYLRREVKLPDGSVAVSKVRLTYPQNWPAYNAAQCEEKARVQILLRGLCDGIVQPPGHVNGGAPRLLLADVIYSATMKVYTTLSGRRATTDIRECEEKGFIEDAPHYNSIFRYLGSPTLIPLLKMLVEEAATPLIAMEANFAVDSTAFSTDTYARWLMAKHGNKRVRAKDYRLWVKAHTMIGTRTKVITSVSVTSGVGADSNELKSLIDDTLVNGFKIAELSADKAYLGNDNLVMIEKAGAKPYIPFKVNSRPGSPRREAWNRLYHYFHAHRDEFFAHYHRRSNVETVYSMIKRKFGAALRSKTSTAQFNETLLKCLCHNLSVLVHEIHELGIEAKFWLPKTAEVVPAIEVQP